MGELFNTDMSLNAGLSMASPDLKHRAHRTDRADVPVDYAAGNPEPAQARLVDRERRPRFADVFPADDGRMQGGSIAVSFAVVSRRRWPR
jgi:hypothetical protein